MNRLQRPTTSGSEQRLSRCNVCWHSLGNCPSTHAEMYRVCLHYTMCGGPGCAPTSKEPGAQMVQRLVSPRTSCRLSTRLPPLLNHFLALRWLSPVWKEAHL